MAINRISHQDFGDYWLVAKRSLKVFSPVLNEVLRFTDPLLESLGLRPEPSLNHRGLSGVRAQCIVAIIRSGSQRENRNRITVIEPKQDRRFELRSSCGRLVDLQASRRPPTLGCWGAHSVTHQKSAKNLCVISIACRQNRPMRTAQSP